MKKFHVILILVTTALFGVLAQAAGTDHSKAIVGATVVDLYGDEPIEDAVVLIEGEKIIAIGSAATVDVPATAEVINAEGTWLIPGLMNMHVHLGLVLPGKLAAELANAAATTGPVSQAEGALRALGTTPRSV